MAFYFDNYKEALFILFGVFFLGGVSRGNVNTVVFIYKKHSKK